MVNFTGGVINYKGSYYPTSNIVSMHSDFCCPNSTIVYFSNGKSEEFSGTVGQWAKACAEADGAKIVDVLA